MEIINVLLSTFPGIGLPKTVSVPVPASQPVSLLLSTLLRRLPDCGDRYIITTYSRKTLSPTSAPVSSLVPHGDRGLLCLQLSLPLKGGKGGFGSQLRAAGGRMSSKRKKDQTNNNGSSRNLDGRRLRTVTEAKALAEYLALKPGMEKKEHDARLKRWQQVVNMAERREEEVKSKSKGKMDGPWVEDKAEAGERTREAVALAMQQHDVEAESDEGSIASTAKNSVNDEMVKRHAIAGGEASAISPSTAYVRQASPRKYVGFDVESDAFTSDEDAND